MKPKDYSAKYGVVLSTLYNSLYSGRIEGTLSNGRWDVKDVPPPLAHSKKSSSTLDGLSDYEIALIWLNGTISGSSLMIRSKDEFVPKHFAACLPGSSWYRDSKEQNVFKTSSLKLCAALRGLGFTGRQDTALPPPPVNPMEFAAALVESRCSFTRALQHTRNRTFSYYTPAIQFCASFPIMEEFVSVMSATGAIPPRKLSPAANKTSATLRITAQSQMEEIHSLLSPIGQNQDFWDEFWSWAHSPRIPR